MVVLGGRVRRPERWRAMMLAWDSERGKGMMRCGRAMKLRVGAGR